MRIETLREFIEFAKYQNLSTAAKKLFITQPALSNHIASLEKELDIELVRHEQTLELTEAGREFFEGCCEVVSTFDALVDRVRTFTNTGGTTGTLTIKANLSSQSGSMRMSEYINMFRNQNPLVTVKVSATSKGSVVEELLEGTLDCALMYNLYPDANGNSFSEFDIDAGKLSYCVIDNAPFTLCAQKSHPLMMQEHVSFKDVIPYPYAMPAGIQFEEMEMSVHRLYNKQGFELKNIHYKIVDSIEELISSKTHGNEILFLGSRPALTGDMTFRPFDPPEYQEFCLVWCNDNQNQALNQFIAMVQERLQQKE